MKIYLDVCCLNRPFDDQTQDRIRIESEAIIMILEKIEGAEWDMVKGPVIDYEVSRIPDEEKREKIKFILGLAKKKAKLNNRILKRAKDLVKKGIKPLDALHISCAEDMKVDYFITTD